MSITTERKPAMTMKNTPHPGRVVLRQCIQPLGLTITEAAEDLGVTRNTLSELVNGKRGRSENDREHYGQRCASSAFNADHVTPSQRS
jgi:Helix-turn-helix